MPPSTVPVLVTPNSVGVVSLDGVATPGQQYLAQARSDGSVVLKPVVKTPFVGEESSAKTSTSGSVSSVS